MFIIVVCVECAEGWRSEADLPSHCPPGLTLPSLSREQDSGAIKPSLTNEGWIPVSPQSHSCLLSAGQAAWDKSSENSRTIQHVSPPWAQSANFSLYTRGTHPEGCGSQNHCPRHFKRRFSRSFIFLFPFIKGDEPCGTLSPLGSMLEEAQATAGSMTTLCSDY